MVPSITFALEQDYTPVAVLSAPVSVTYALSGGYSSSSAFLWNSVSDPTTTWSDISDPSTTWASVSDPSTIWTKVDYPN